jgi:hypothetical protein
MMSEKSIATFGRFVYLNAYAFLLLFLGVGIAFIPIYRFGQWWLVAVQAVAVFFILKGSVEIFRSWNDKKRKYHVLIERNAETIRHDTFSEYMTAPCGRLLVKIVLKDLDKQNEYKKLTKAHKPKKSIVYVREINKPT